MKKLSKEQVLMLHSQLIQQTGGSDGVRIMLCWSLHWKLHSSHSGVMNYIQQYSLKQRV